ncbi:hypothetical protein Syun_021549 [Stephania yunnanensis]|uniref:Kinesin motor domain-containing protein n=1 Tax=Stephania yunnanensis TaxID=152371 RepID=A0AAP0IHS1_9MAGN
MNHNTGRRSEGRNKESDFGADPMRVRLNLIQMMKEGGHRKDGQGIQMALGLHYMLLVKLIDLRAGRFLRLSLVHNWNKMSKWRGYRVDTEEEITGCKEEEALNKILDIKGDGKNCIRVFCRVRPFLITDKRRNQEFICVRSEKLAVSFGGNKKEFGFDKAFPQNASQEDVFMEVEPILRSALDGHNVCIMAYGLTGTGKTFTMLQLREGQSQLCKSKATIRIASTVKAIVDERIASTVKAIVDERIGNGEVSNKQGDFLQILISANTLSDNEKLSFVD